MSTVDKMLIKGIRSFDPENKNVITFFKPLTLIVGPNGAGKTTIIECLKVACTGELPPNARSGHSFVHDPKVAGETETKGQIKLRFKTAARKDVVCIRSFQLTQKATKMEYKAIESVLQTINPQTGEKVCLSYRCADMDREIPALMGVSKAILENVIFVHQDEANWPLQDPSTLKKKFDDIFSATRYTKALEVIKKLHKDQAQEIKAYKLKLENLQTLKDAAYKFRDNITQDQEKSEASTRQTQELELKIQNLNSEISQTELTLKDLQTLQGEIALKRGERKSKFEELQNRYAALPEENEDTDEELNEWKTKFDQMIATLESKSSKLSMEKTDIGSKCHNIKSKISDLQAAAKIHESLKNERDLAIRRLFRKHNLGSLQNTSFSDEVSYELANRIQSKLENLSKDLQDQKISNEKEIEASLYRYMHASNQENEIEAQKKAKLELKNGNLKQIKQKQTERDSLEAKMPLVDVSIIDERERSTKQTERDSLEAKMPLVDVSIIDERESSTQLELDKKADLIAARNFESNLEQKQMEKYKLDQEIKALNNLKEAMDNDFRARTILSVKKTELESHKKKHKRIVDEYKDRIRGVLKGRMPADRDIYEEIVKAQSSLQKEYDDLEKKADVAKNEVTVLRGRIQEAESNLSKYHKVVESRTRFIESKLKSLNQQFINVDSYLEILEAAKKKSDVQKSKYHIADGMRQMYDPYERVARAHHWCPCCERPFSANEEDEFVKKQRVLATSTSERMKVLVEESSKADSHFQQLENIRSMYEEYVKTRNELIPFTEKNLKQLVEDLGQSNLALDDVLGVLAQIKTEKDTLDLLLQPVETTNRLLQEKQALQEQVDDLERNLDIHALDARSLDEVTSELKVLEETRSKVYDDMEKLRSDQVVMEREMSTLQSRWARLREEKSKVGNLISDIQRTEEELDRLAEENNQIEFDLKHLTETLGPLLKEKKKLHEDYINLKSSLSNDYESQAKCYRENEKEFETLLDTITKIKQYDHSKMGDELKSLEEKLTLSKSELDKGEARMKDITIELDKCKDLIRDQAQLKRNIEENLVYRKVKTQVDELTREIESLEESVLKLGGLSRIEAQNFKLSQEREGLLTELNKHHGILSVFKSNIDRNRLELKHPQYKDIDKRYFDQLIQLKTTEMANKDLDRYYKALDKALMRFHTMKMEEINKIIRELWQQTYRGQDIDYIRIHSDSEGAGTRSYSYKVLMQTGDTELEMRGRCSAGQKALASLIIRLSLAETFCLNCGILALDEPTTNLDGPNSESLAAALLRIMEDRKGQENFQLIVITHDERFAQFIGQRQHAEKYYRITKDDYQHSIIEAQEIFD